MNKYLETLRYIKEKGFTAGLWKRSEEYHNETRSGCFKHCR